MSRPFVQLLVLASGLCLPISACSSCGDDTAAIDAGRNAPKRALPDQVSDGRVVREETVPPRPKAEVRRPATRAVRALPPVETPPSEGLPTLSEPPVETETPVTPPEDVPPEVPSAPPPPPEAVQAPTPADRRGLIPVSVDDMADAMVLQLRLKQLEDQNQELRRRLEKLEGKVGRIDDNTSHETLGFGLGLASGLKEAKGEYRLVLEANLRYVTASIYAKTGFSLGLAANLRIWDLQLHWIGVGVMYYGDGRALSVPEYGRSCDLMLTSGLDWRIWNGLELRAQVAWFIPPPGPIYDRAKKRLEEAVDDFDVNDTKPAEKAPKDAWGIVTDAYGRAFRSPYLVFGLRWEF